MPVHRGHREPKPEPEPEPQLEPEEPMSNEEEEEVVCRICRMEGEEGWPLFHPCKCSGSIKYVHQDCLQMWMDHSSITVCELCNHTFAFEKVYAPDAPTVLPSHEFAAGLFARATGSLQFASRLVLVLLVWLVVIPVGTCWILRLLFARSFRDIADLFRDVGTESVLGDCVYGSVLSVAIVLVFLGIASLRDFVRENQMEDEARHLMGLEAQHDGPRHVEEPGAGAADGAVDGAPAAAAAATVPVAIAEDVPVDDLGAGMFDVNDHEVPFDELVGLRGPLQHLGENVVTVLASNSIFLALFCFVPFTVGRAVLAALPKRTNVLLPLVLQPAMLDYEDQFAVATGYAVMTLLCSVWAIITVSLRSRYPWLQTPFIGVILAGISQVYIFTKVSTLLFVELGAFPCCCGVWLDVCTLRLVGATLGERIAFATDSSVSFCLVHWLVGIIYMLYISLFVSLLREVMRPELFWFLRNPDDPNYHPFRDLVEESVFKHARRVVLSAMIYAPLIVMLVWTPVQLLSSCSLGGKVLLPLNIHFRDPYTEVPADIILFHVCVPFTLEHFHPRDCIKSFIRTWCAEVGGWLRITHFVLPPGDLTAEEWQLIGVTKDEVLTSAAGTAAGAQEQQEQQEPEREPEPEQGPEQVPQQEPELQPKCESAVEPEPEPMLESEFGPQLEPESRAELEPEPHQAQERPHEAAMQGNDNHLGEQRRPATAAPSAQREMRSPAAPGDIMRPTYLTLRSCGNVALLICGVI
jgi:E3 ubiquitin-protein ligase MARCH6